MNFDAALELVGYWILGMVVGSVLVGTCFVALANVIDYLRAKHRSL